MVIYSIFDSESDSSYFATLAEAREAKKKWYSDEAEIERLTLVKLPPRALAVRLLTGEAFVVRRETVS